MRRSIAAAALGLIAFACGGGPDSVLGTGPRIPDAEGIATEVTLEQIEIDGDKTYPIGDGVESFTTRSHEVTPLLTWKDKYVHVGLNDDGDVDWVAGIGTVVDSKPSYTLYTGIFEAVDDETGRAVFEDGTTLELASGVKPPAEGEAVVTIDPAKHAVTKIVSAG